EHDLGRSHVRQLEEAVREAQAGRSDRYPVIAEHALAYAELLKDHIAKEDTVLYPLAERVLPEGVRPQIVAGYTQAELQVPENFGRHYQSVVELYESETH
ncbi:MAG: hemerythrin domain-containing protein, partial [Geobacter sp.]